MVASPDNFPLLKELLAEQQRLDTPVARFSGLHSAGGSPSDKPIYRDSIPLTAPRPGEQYAFEVALDSCTGCKACVSACHSLNGLDEQETWRDVGLVVGGEERHPFQQTITTACHHCADPACLNGCPVLAYEKDPVTGIVRHLDDQCIGCQYCILKCPYDVPKYNARLGIVRKCDLCHSRLAEGEAPACVQACPTHAIRIITVELAPATASSVTSWVASSDQAVRVDTSHFLAAAPDPGYTQPTTRYVSAKGLPIVLRPADANTLRLQPAHWPLAIMLTLMPLAVGAHVAAAWVTYHELNNQTYYGSDVHTYYVRLAEFIGVAGVAGGRVGVGYGLTLLGWVAGAVGLGASIAHLGKPLRAWKIFLGWRRSWLSREGMLFGAWFGFASASAALPLPLMAKALQSVFGVSPATFGAIRNAVVFTSAGVGVLGLFCSAMIYIDTRRKYWRWTQTGPRFFGSAAILGAAGVFALGIDPVVSAWILGLSTVVKLAFEVQAVRPAGEADEETPPNPWLNTARILAGPLRGVWGSRVAGALIFSGLLPAMSLAGVISSAVNWLIFGGVLAGELTERYLFFRAVDAPKMPGLPAGVPRKGGQPS